jgi:hypothetical protein
MKSYRQHLARALESDQALMVVFGPAVAVATVWWLLGVGSVPPFNQTKEELANLPYVITILAFFTAALVWLLREYGGKWLWWGNLVGVPAQRPEKEVLARDLTWGLAVGVFCFMYALVADNIFPWPRPPEPLSNPPANFASVIAVSMRAGIGEEIVYRWVMVGGLYVLLSPLFKTPWLLMIALGAFSVGVFELSHLRSLESTVQMLPVATMFFMAYWVTGRQLVAPITTHVYYDVCVYSFIMSANTA